MPRPDVSHERIPQILNAAAELFSRRGIDGAGMNELSQATGLSKAAIYHYFPSKEEIIHALVERLFTDDQPYLQALVEDQTRGAAERILDYVDHLASFLGKTSGLQPVYLECYARAGRDERVAELVGGFFKGYQRMAEQILRQGVTSGDLSADTDTKRVSSVLITQIEGCIVIAKLTGQRLGPLLRRNMRWVVDRL